MRKLSQFKQASTLKVVWVANSKIKLELGCLKLKITLTFTIRLQHQSGREPYRDDQKQVGTKGRGEQRLQA
jgi:hypothetical protein